MKEESQRAEIRRLLDEAAVDAPAEATIRGDGNIVSSQVTIRNTRSAPGSRPRGLRGEPSRRQLLQAVRVKAARLTLTDDEICDIATHELRKKVIVLSLNGLGNDDLARVYEALSARQRLLRVPADQK